MGSESKARPAYVDDVDEESGKAVRGTRRSASTREKPKVHREGRPSKPRRSQTESISPTEHTSTAIQHVEIMNREQAMKLERRPSSSKSPRKTTRPPSSHETRGYPKLSIPNKSNGRDDQSYYGIPTPTTASSMASSNISLAHRPRALTTQTYPRPQSYHSAAQSTYGGGGGPPLSMSAYYQQPQPNFPTSYPPPAQNYVRYAPPLQVQQGDYFGSQQLVPRPLASRFEMVRSAHPTFDPISRTTSAFGTRDMPSPSEFDDDGYNSASESATIRRTRRPSILRGPPMTREEDSLAMPPPPIPRPGILRRSTDYPIEAPDPDDYRLTRNDYPQPTRPRRPSANRHSVSYDLSTGSGRVTVEAANSSRRRQSWYDQPESSTASSGYEAQLNQATEYQEDVTGGPTAPLTAEMLKRQQKREVGSSRSTKSSASRDDSDYKKSATTRTTRSGSGNDDENMTIKVTGQARVMVGGTQIDCTEGGAIEIKRESKNIRTGSERSNSVYGGGRHIEERRIEDGRRNREDRRIEDGRRAREERPAGRSRMSSSGRSHARKSQHYSSGADFF